MKCFAIPLLSAGVVAIALAGCSDRPTRLVSGRLDVAHYHLVGAQVIALSSSGSVYRAPIAPATGAFRIALPTGSTYMVRFANTTASSRLFDAFAVLAPTKASGARTHWFTLTAGGPINLGRITKAGTLGSQILTRHDDSSGGDDEADDRDDGEEDDDAEACDLDDGRDLEEAESEHNVLDDNDSDDDGVADSADDSDDRPTCASARDDGDDCELSDDQEHEDEADDDAQCAGGSGGSGGSGGGVGSNPPSVPGIG